MNFRLLIMFSLFISTTIASAAIQRNLEFIKNGVIHGGEAKYGFTILNAHFASDKKTGSEMILIDLGDRQAKPLNDEVGYYHAYYNGVKKILSIDLAQMTQSALNPTNLRILLRKSKLVANYSMTAEPEDSSTNISLLMKYPSEVRLYSKVNGSKASQLVIEFRKAGIH